MSEFIQSYLDLFRNYANFNGRWSRRQYWGAVLINFLICSVLMMLVKAVPLFAAVQSIYGLALLLPMISAEVRRLHDIGKKGINLLWVLVPVVGAVLLVIWWCKPGDAGDNEFGADPKIAPEFSNL